jgi:hypothetical protein
MRRITLVAVLFCVLLAVVGTGQAAAKSLERVVLHPRFDVVGSASFVDADGRYTFLGAPLGATSVRGTLIDELTGSRSAIPLQPPTPGCGLNETGPEIQGPWLIGGACFPQNNPGPPGPASVELYRLSAATWHIFQFTIPFCAILGTDCTVGPAGAKWVQVTESCYHCTTRVQFVNLASGQVVDQPTTGPKTVLDLNSSTLTHRLCSPVRAPRHTTVTFYGKFAVVGNATNERPNYLERCGSPLHKRIWSGTALGNSQELLSYVANSERLQGITLPGLRRFVVALPKKFPVGFTGFALSSRTLYANDQTVWSTRAPLPR